MKKVAVLLSVMLLALVALPALAAEAAKPMASTMTGWVTDSHCGVKGANAKHTAACVEKCVKGGSKVQFYDDASKKLYDVDKDHATAMIEHTGHQIKVTGTVEGSMLTVEKIEMASSSMMKKMK